MAKVAKTPSTSTIEARQQIGVQRQTHVAMFSSALLPTCPMLAVWASEVERAQVQKAHLKAGSTSGKPFASHRRWCSRQFRTWSVNCTRPGCAEGRDNPCSLGCQRFKTSTALWSLMLMHSQPHGLREPQNTSYNMLQPFPEALLLLLVTNIITTISATVTFVINIYPAGAL